MQVHAITIGLPMPVPILAKAVRAGFPSPADDSIEDEIDLQRLFIANRPATFLVRVASDSMVLAKLFDGDIAVVDRSLNHTPIRPHRRRARKQTAGTGVVGSATLGMATSSGRIVRSDKTR